MSRSEIISSPCILAIGFETSWRLNSTGFVMESGKPIVATLGMGSWSHPVHLPTGLSDMLLRVVAGLVELQMPLSLQEQYLEEASNGRVRLR